MPIEGLTYPPEAPAPYLLDRHDGETQSMPGFKGVFQFYATQKQTDNAISVFCWDGTLSDQPLHSYKKTHDCFLVMEGRLKVYCGDSSRILGPGDFATASPGANHKPTPLDPITKTIPLIHPADWFDNFDREFNAKNTPPEIYHKYDSYPVEMELPEPSPWTEKDWVLPDGEEPYFLKYNRGPRWVLGGVHSRPFITTKQCSGKFFISCIETSTAYGPSVFKQKLSFPVYDVLIFFDGKVDIAINDETEATEVTPGEVVVIPKDVPFSLDFKTKYVRFYSYSSGDGLDALVNQAGLAIERVSISDEAHVVDQYKLKAVMARLQIKVHD
ncbi:RmlC-like cupin domain-containing protein [Aspergillus karnatakaensis]|uniref:RmlC-like cupin domain-containing protein n=1 Tax=Aspergillus karnatakaensis TaxID=1810916 RepID=UPI003CCCC61A